MPDCCSGPQNYSLGVLPVETRDVVLAWLICGPFFAVQKTIVGSSASDMAELAAGGSGKGLIGILVGVVPMFGGAYLIQQKLLENAKKQAAAMGAGNEGDAKAQ